MIPLARHLLNTMLETYVPRAVAPTAVQIVIQSNIFIADSSLDVCWKPTQISEVLLK